MAASSWWVSSGGHSTTRLIPTSSTDHRDGAISSIMTFLLLLSVFLLLSCVLFLMVLFSWAASTSIAQGTVCNQHQRKTAKSTILCPCNLPWGMHTYVFFLFCVFSQFSPCGTVFERWTLILRLIEINLHDVRKKNVISRFNRSSKACSLSSNDVSLAAIVSAIVSPWSQIWSIFTSCLMVDSFFSPPPARQPAPAGLCQIVYYISPESELLVLGILIEFVQLSLSVHTA